MVDQSKSKKKATKKPKLHEADGFDPRGWKDVALEIEKTYFVLFQREQLTGVTALDAAEVPYEVRELEFLGYVLKKGKTSYQEEPPPVSNFGGYAFDGLNVKRTGNYYGVAIEWRELLVWPKTQAGKKEATELAKEWSTRNKELIKLARDKDDEVTRKTAMGVSNDELITMAIGLGGDDDTFAKTSKSPAKRAEKLLALKATYLEKKAKGPIPDRPSSTRLK